LKAHYEAKAFGFGHKKRDALGFGASLFCSFLFQLDRLLFLRYNVKKQILLAREALVLPPSHVP